MPFQFSSLHIISLNVRGLSLDKATHIADLGQRQRVDIFLFQETHLHLFSGHRFNIHRRFRDRGWTPFWGLAPNARTAGVAILVRTSLLDDPSFTLLQRPSTDPALNPDPSRILSIRFRFYTSTFSLSSIYVPASAPEQRPFLDRLQTLFNIQSALPGHVVWGGDFNFVSNPDLERWPYHPNRQPDALARAWSLCPFSQSLSDVFRSHHPNRTVFTFHRGPSASYLDRFYAPPALLPYAKVAIPATFPFSDHRPVSLFLRGAPAIPARDRAPPRLRFKFRTDTAFNTALSDWIRQAALTAPAADRDFLIWWPAFKTALANTITDLSKAFSTTSELKVAETRAELDRLNDALDNGINPPPLADLLRARARHADALRQDQQVNAAHERRAYIHNREQPSPALTAKLTPPKSSAIPPLRHPDGHLAPTPTGQANIAIKHWASVSRQPATSQAAATLLLNAIPATCKLSDEDADALDNATITVAEVKRALKTIPSGRSPGLDRIPCEFYRWYPDVLLPLLSRLYSSLISLNRLPNNFCISVISFIAKSRPPSDNIADYRPISLLNSDYRILSKILANRLRKPLASILPRIQTAFLPGRQIGDSILTLQFVSALLPRSEEETVWALFCDFMKAYDTVDRSFLFRVMSHVGIPDRFTTLCRLLLSPTFSCAKVNRALSAPHYFAAGVRQGCPIAPLLYLFIGLAIHSFLVAEGFEPDLQLSPTRSLKIFGAQYADDLTILLRSLARLPALLAAFNTIADATGQRLNPRKSAICPLGGVNVPAVLPAVVHGIPVTRTQKTLGVFFGDTTLDPRANRRLWNDRLAALTSRLDKIHSLSLSTFGRAFASSCYGASRFLFHLEFADPESFLQLVNNAQAQIHRLTSSNRSSTARGRAFGRFVQLPTYGPPALGGYGVIPIREHYLSRHAKWALSLICHRPAPWLDLALFLISSLSYNRLTPIALFNWPYPLDFTPQPLRRLVEGLRALPPPTVDPAAQPNHLAFYAPFWGNPCLDYPEKVMDGPVDLGRMLFHQSSVGPALQTLGDFVLMCFYAGVFGPPWNPYDAFLNPLPDRHSIADALNDYALALPHHGHHDRLDEPCRQLRIVWTALPFRWRTAAKAALEALQLVGQVPAGDRTSAYAFCISALSYFDPIKATPVPVAKFAVRLGTALQLYTDAKRTSLDRRYYDPYLSMALGRAPTAPDRQHLRDVFSMLWDIKICNRWRELFWHVVYDGVPCAARLHLPNDTCYACGHMCPGREHLFWDCPVLDRLKQDIQNHLPPPLLLSKSSLWLPHVSPSLSIRVLVWRVVSIAFFSAADSARRTIYRMSQSDPRPTPVETSQRASYRARYRFWSVLIDFQKFTSVPKKWLASLPTDHPFLFRDAASGRLEVERVPP